MYKWVVSTVGLLTRRATMSLCVQVLHAHLFSVLLGGNGIVGSCGNSVLSFSRDCQTAFLRAPFQKDPHSSDRTFVLANEEGHGKEPGKPAERHGEPGVLTHKASDPSLPSQIQTPSLRRATGASLLPCTTPFLPHAPSFADCVLCFLTALNHMLPSPCIPHLLGMVWALGQSTLKRNTLEAKLFHTRLYHSP